MREKLRRLRDHPMVLDSLVVLLQSARRHGLFQSERYYRHVPYRGPIDVDMGAGRSFRIISRGLRIENCLFWEGAFAHEPASMRQWIALAGSARTVIDVGANSGVFALAAATVGSKRVHAFEPLPRVHAILSENVAANRLPMLMTWQIAISDRDGTADLMDPGGTAPTSASLSTEYSNSRFGTGVTPARVPVSTLDAFCREHDVDDIDLIKLDVEGHEEAALRGMHATVMRHKPSLLVEVLPEYDARLRSVVTELFGDAYRWHRIDEGNGAPNRNVLLQPLGR